MFRLCVLNWTVKIAKSSRTFLSVLRIKTKSSLFTRPAKRNNDFCNQTCVFIRSTYVSNAKQVTCWHRIFIPYSHIPYSYHIHTRYSSNQCFQKSRTITVNSDTNHLKSNSLNYLLACNWRYWGLESFALSKLSDVEITCLPERTLM